MNSVINKIEKKNLHSNTASIRILRTEKVSFEKLLLISHVTMAIRVTYKLHSLKKLHCVAVRTLKEPEKRA